MLISKRSFIFLLLVSYVSTFAFGCSLLSETRKKAIKKEGQIVNSPDIGDLQIFPSDNSWNTDISNAPAHPRSGAYIDSIGRDEELHPDFGTVYDGEPIGIPFVVVSGNQPKVPVSFEYADESNPGPYPIPDNAPIEAGDDAHIIIIDEDNHMLYELYAVEKVKNGWKAGSGAKWNLDSNKLRPKYWTSANAAGLPILPGLVRYDEVAAGEITHALRFTAEETQMGFISPARHYASDSTDPNLPPMGLRLRLKKDFDISGFSRINQIILQALKKYGIILADNGGNWFVSGAPDSRWDDEDLHELSTVKGDDFEAVDTGSVTGPEQ